MVLITGSKFYNAPPFCGALLVPHYWSNQLIGRNSDIFKYFSDFFSKDDIPKRFYNIKNSLTENENNGLRLRWDCALIEMEAAANYSRNQFVNVILSWNSKVTEIIASSKTMELMPDHSQTEKSIISFRLKVCGYYLSYFELKILFENLAARRYDFKYSYKKIFIGQPVKFGSMDAFMRISIGSCNIRDILDGNNMEFSEDLVALKHIENEAIRLKRYSL